MKIERAYHYFKPNEKYFTITTWSSCDRYESHITGNKLVIDREDEVIYIFCGDERKAVGRITVEPGLFGSVVKSITEDGLIDNIEYVPQLFNRAPKFKVGDEVFAILCGSQACIESPYPIAKIYDDGNGNFSYTLEGFSRYGSDVFNENEIFKHRTDLAMELDRLEQENKNGD